MKMRMFSAIIRITLIFLVVEIRAESQVITTVAGNGIHGYSGDGGSALTAELALPTGLTVDIHGNIFIADQSNFRVRKVNATTGVITTIAGNGSYDYGGDGGLAVNASLKDVNDMVVTRSGDIYIADAGNHRIRKIDALTGIITTIAGNGSYGYSGDGGLATNAQLNFPIGLAIDSAGNFFIADYYNSVVRKVDAVTGIITTIAGNGSYGYSGDGGPATSASLQNPVRLATDTSGNIFIADLTVHVIRKVNISNGIITTVAGNGIQGYSGEGGLATNAQLSNPHGVAVDRYGNIYIADESNFRIREVSASNKNIYTVAGNGTSGFNGDGIQAVAAELNHPTGIALDSARNIFIADRFNERIRHITPVALPLKLTYFSALLQQQNILLQWTTTREINSSFFEIERSVDGSHFSGIGKVNATQKVINDYSYVDSLSTSPLKSPVYYRLKMVDLDGRYAYSETKSVNIKKGFFVTLFPNPSDDHLNVVINASQNDKAYIEVVNMDGKIFLSTSINISAGLSTQNMNIAVLRSGIYFLKVKTSEGSATIKFVKNK